MSKEIKIGFPYNLVPLNSVEYKEFVESVNELRENIINDFTEMSKFSFDWEQEKIIDNFFAQKLIDAGYNFIARDKGGLFATSSDAWIFHDGWWIIDKTPQKIWKIEINVFQFLTGEETEMTNLKRFIKENEK